MGEQATLAIVHHDRSEGLVDFAKKASASSKQTGDAQKFLTYVPVHGPKDVAYVWFKHDSHAALHAEGSGALAAVHGPEVAASVAKKALAGVKKHATVLLHRTASGGIKAGSPPKYVVAYMVKVDPGKMGAVREGAKKLIAGNAASSHPLHFSIHKPTSGKSGERLVLLGVDSLSDLDRDGHTNKPRAAEHHGHEGAAAAGQSLVDGVKAIHKQVLRYVPELSHA